MTSQREREEFTRNLEGLSPYSKQQAINYLQTLVYCERQSFEPPTVEQWRKVPDWLRWLIFFQIVWGVLQVKFAGLMWQIGNRLSGGRKP